MIQSSFLSPSTLAKIIESFFGVFLVVADTFSVARSNFVFLVFFQSTDVSTGARKAKSRHDMDTAGLRVEIISLFMFTELLYKFNTIKI